MCRTQKILISLILILLNLVLNALYAQNQANIWYFGKGVGLDFNAPSAPLGLQPSKMYSLSENASICDENGQLLFYTDGSTVWDKTHQILQDGKGLMGNYSVLIVPKPEAKHLYYIFTLGYKTSENLKVEDTLRFVGNSTRKKEIDLGITLQDIKLCYNLIDTKQGRVLKKNQPLHQGLALDITAVRHANQKDFWLISHPTKSRDFQAFLINENGILQRPIRSQAGSLVYTNYNRLGNLVKTTLKVNLEGNKLASNLAALNAYEIEIFDFDNATGQISYQQTLKIPRQPYQNNPWIHGFEFSPDGKKLYVTANAYEGHTYLYQFDLIVEDSTEPKVKKYASNLYGKYRHNLLRDMQIAPDYKIYIASGLSPVLAVINQPNETLETCDLVFKDSLLSNHTGLHLPQCTHLIPAQRSIQINKPFTRKVLFASGKAIIQEKYLEELRDIVAFLQQHPSLQIAVSGHTDSIGNSESNQRLSEERAKAVADYFIQNGINEECVTYTGCGDKVPIADNKTAEGRAKNRRITFLIKYKPSE